MLISFLGEHYLDLWVLSKGRGFFIFFLVCSWEASFGVGIDPRLTLETRMVIGQHMLPM